jgi:hypothetical protein
VLKIDYRAQGLRRVNIRNEFMKQWLLALHLALHLALYLGGEATQQHGG